MDIDISPLEIEKIEDYYSNKNFYRNPVFINGEKPIIISIPHCIEHKRAGNYKRAELYTLSLGIFLNRLTNCHICFNTDKNIDPNYDEEDIYKQELSSYIDDKRIWFLIDLHGALKERDFDIEIGTAHNQNINNYTTIVDVFTSFAESHIIKIQKDILFTASNKNTVSSFINNRNQIPCVQLEINRTFREIENIERMKQMVSFLKDCINAINIMIPDYHLFQVCMASTGRFIKPINRVEVSEDFIKKQDIVVNGKNDFFDLSGKKNEGVIFKNSSLKGNAISVTERFYNENCLGSNILLFKKYSYHNVKYLKPKIEEIDNVAICVSNDLFEELEGVKLVELLNPFNSTRGTFRIKNYTTPKEHSSTIWLSFFQRKLLNIELPFIISATDFKQIKTKLSKEEFSFFKDYYLFDSNSNEFKIKKNSEYELIKLKTIYKSIQNLLLLRPLEFKNNQIKQSFLLKKLIGRKTIQLRIARGNEIEDNFEVARLTKNNLKILGIEETDKIIITYKGVSQRVIVHAIEDNEYSKMVQINNLNAEEDIDLIVCLPIKVRHNLGMTDNNDTVYIERDMKSLFYKNLYAQLITIIGLFIAIFGLSSKNEIWFNIILFVVISPIAIYSILSKEREKI